MATKEKSDLVSAAELAEALIEALQQSAVGRGVPETVAADSLAQDAITEYQAIVNDLVTLPL